MTRTPTLSTCLWFDGVAEQAANFYVSIFKNSRVTGGAQYGEAGPGPKADVMTVSFELDGRPFLALNGGPLFKFNESISIMVNCEDQDEIDHYWRALTAGGGAPGRCGWLKDRFGLSWQVIPSMLEELLLTAEPAAADRYMKALMSMDKLDIARLRAAHAGE